MAVEQFCLKWNNFQSSIITAFGSLQSTEDLADVTLTCEGTNVKAHKIILSACSPYFRAVFKENPCSHPIVILKDVSHSDLLAVLNFMYHGEVLITQDKLLSFLQTAEALQVSGLVGNPGFQDLPVNLTSNLFKNRPKPKPEFAESVPKKIKLSPKPRAKSESRPLDNPSTSLVNRFPETPPLRTENPVAKTPESSPKTSPEVVPVDGIKTEAEEFQGDHNFNDKIDAYNINEKKGSILEAALEVKDQPSILERSLLHTNKSPLAPYVVENVTLIQQPSPEPENYSRKSDKWDSSESPTSNDETKSIEAVPTLPSDVSLVNVRMVHQDIQPHHSSQCGNCPHCGKIYSNQSALKYHVRLVHSDLTNMYCCHLCPESFDYREGYKKHMVEVHSVRN